MRAESAVEPTRSENITVTWRRMLDIAGFHWVEWMQDDHSVSNGEHDKCAKDTQIAAICTDTWGVEMRPNETNEVHQPWHWVVIPAMDLCMGEIFYLKDLAEDCAKDEFFAADHHRRHWLTDQSASD